MNIGSGLSANDSVDDSAWRRDLDVQLCGDTAVEPERDRQLVLLSLPSEPASAEPFRSEWHSVDAGSVHADQAGRFRLADSGAAKYHRRSGAQCWLPVRCGWSS
jgi:hypothetical protein